MGLFSCTRCKHYTAGPSPRCARGYQLTSSPAALSGAIPLVVIDEGCDDFTLRPATGDGTSAGAGGGGGVLAGSAKAPALRGGSCTCRQTKTGSSETAGETALITVPVAASRSWAQPPQGGLGRLGQPGFRYAFGQGR